MVPGTRRWRSAVALLAGFGLAAAVAAGIGGARADDTTVSAPQAPGKPTAEQESERILAAAAAARSIDREVGKVLLAEGIDPAGPSDDAEFLRRVTLDLIGAPPTEEEVKAFLASKDPVKRSAKIEELLKSPLFGDRMGDLWGRLLFSGIKKYPQPEVQKVFAWLAEGFNQGKGMDWLVRELVTATGNTQDNPALAYTLRFRDGGIPADIAGTTSRVFLGVQIQCAQCHDHPYEPWKKGEFAGFAAFFNLVQPRVADPMDKKGGGFVVEDPPMRALVRSKGRGGEGADIKGAARADPKFLGGPVYHDSEDTTRRRALADWILDRKNPWFAKAMVNRVWSWYFGRGIFNPVDDFRTDTVPTHPALLDTLALGFAESGYDLRFLARAITLSGTYQRTSRLPKDMQAAAKRGKEDDAAVEKLDHLYARGPIKPLTADQVFDSVLRITGMDDAFRRLNRAEIERAKVFLLQQFVSEIDDDEMNSSEQWAGTIPQGLLLMNGPLTQVGTRATAAAGRGDRLSILARENTLHRVLDDTKDAGARVDRIYLVALGRHPSEHEASEAAVFAARGKAPQGWEDLFWALINCSEFMSNH